MADVVTTQTIVDTVGTKTVIKMTNISDGTGETLVTKADASALNFMTEDATKKIAKIYWSVNTTNGKSGVELLFAGSGANAANATIGFFSGTDSMITLQLVIVFQTTQHLKRIHHLQVTYYYLRKGLCQAITTQSF